jgi:3-oxoacyl-[acyl-carrier-protein] synthase II
LILFMQHERNNRVVITGIGLVNPLGNDTQTTWQGIIAGRSGIRTIPKEFGLSAYHVTTAGLVTDEQAWLDKVLPAKFHSKTDRFIHLSLIAGHQAMVDSGLDQTVPENRERFGAYVGVGMGGLGSVTEAVRDLDHGGFKKLSPFIIPKTISNLAPAWLSMQWNLQGPITAFTNACSSSADAIGVAFRLIRDGYADYMLAGGAECCTVPIAIVGFGNMRALSTWSGDPAQASRPFDRDRTGFVIAEGAAVLILERLDMAQARGAHIYAELVGYGASADAYHITAMHPEARGAVAAMQHALADANIQPSAIGYINAHGTGTPMNDPTETLALKKVFGHLIDPSNPEHICVSSTKSMTGHMLGAAGATEAAFTALALQRGILPPTINLDTPDTACDLDYIPHHARQQTIDYALSNSFGFGGGNAVLVIKRWI